MTRSLSNTSGLCPRHGEPVDSCEGCAVLIARRQDARASAPGEHERTAERLYERQLDRQGGSR